MDRSICVGLENGQCFVFLSIGFIYSRVCLYLVTIAKCFNTGDVMKKYIRHFEIIYTECFKFSNNSLLFVQILT